MEEEQMSEAIRWAGIGETPQHPGHFRRQVEYDTAYLALHRYTEGGEGYAVHSHGETQSGYVLDGEMAMILDGDNQTISANHAYIIPGSSPHGGKAGAAQSNVLNLYVKKHLAQVVTAPTPWTDWRGPRAPFTAFGVRQSLIRLEPGASAPPAGKVHDVFDVLLDGALGDLAPRDVVRGVDIGLKAGPGGARLFRMEILA